jgi:hypothetical protein
MKCKALRHGFPLVVVGILILPTILSAQKSLSHVRVVRLSYVSGTVGVKRPASTEWAKGQLNTPIQEGFELSTAANSYAEVEFENGSTARLGEFSKVNFDQLAMDESGNKLNRLTFEQGYATFHLLPEHQDAYSVKIAEATLTPNGKSEFRTDLEHGRGRVEVFSGSVELAAASRTVKLGKDKVLEFDPQAAQLALNAQPGIVKDSWDKWTSARDTQTQLSLRDQAVGSPGPLYGWSDLNAYGEWGYFPGFGYGWAPFASAGWSPYGMGMWSWYPGMGYAWISGEPWGWLPYHYGSWNFSPGFGYFWMPGSMGNFSPALVSWYSGPGWIGWAPRGAAGASGQRIVTTVPGGVVQNGLAIDSQIVNHELATAGTLVRNLPFQPGAGAMLSGPPLSGNAEALFTPHEGAPHSMAPSSILAGGDAEKEQSLQGKHSAHQPLRARLGTTLGGRYTVGGAVGEFRGNALSGIRGAGGPKAVNGPQGPGFSIGAGTSGPIILAHGQQSAVSSQGGVGGTMPSGGGGYGNSAPATMSAVSASSGHSASSASSGGGHH